MNNQSLLYVDQNSTGKFRTAPSAMLKKSPNCSDGTQLGHRRLISPCMPRLSAIDRGRQTGGKADD
jgi:hypothetical protein